MTILTPELAQFTITNPVVYSEFDSDLEGKSLGFAERRMAERWNNENIMDITNPLKGNASYFVNMADILSPVVHDEIQKLINADMPEEQRAEEWSRIHFPDMSFKTLLIDNVHPQALLEGLEGVETKDIGSPELFKEIVDRIAKTGVIVSPDQVKQALLSRYVKDSVALERVSEQVGIAGKVFSSIGNFYVHIMTDPFNAIGDLVSLEVGGGVAEAIAKQYALGGLGSKALTILSDSIALGEKHVAILGGITNSRRADVGLRPIPTTDVFASDVLAGIVLGGAFSGAFVDGAAVLFRKATAYLDKTLARRAVETAQDARGRYKHSTASDAEILNRMNDAAVTGEELPKPEFKLDISFPRISDPSVPDVNRAFNNSIGSVMQGTQFSTDVSGFFSARLSGWVVSMSESELFLMSEGLAKAKTFPKFYSNFISNVKEASSQAEFVSGLRKLISSSEEDKELFGLSGNVIHNEAETNRNMMGYSSLYSNVEGILSGAEAEGVSAQKFRTDRQKFLTERPELSPENPYSSAVSETDIKLAGDWERIRVQSEAVIGKRATFKPSDFLVSTIEELNGYSANVNSLRAEFGNKFAIEMDGIGVSELLEAWGDTPTSRGSKIKNLLNELKTRMRNIAKEYGVTYGEIEDHIPQKWAQEKVSASGFEKFQSDFIPELDIERTKKAYYAGVKESFDKAEAELNFLTQKAEVNASRGGIGNEKRARTLAKDIKKAQVRVSELGQKLKAQFGEKEMRQIYDNIVTDNLLDPSTHTPKPTMNTNRRILYFKDIKSFDALNSKYGVNPDFRVLVTRDLDSMIREIARLRAFSGTEEFFSRNVESSLKVLLGNRQLGFAERQLKSIVDANIGYVSGKFGRETSMATAFGRVYLSLIRMAALGGAGLTTFFDDAHSVAFAGSQNGFGFMRTIGEYIRGLTKVKITPEEASRLLVALDDVSRGFDEEVYRYPTERSVATVSKTAESVDKFTFKVNGVNYLTDRGRVTFNKLFLQELGAIGTEGNPKMREVLSGYGLTDTDFANIAKVQLDVDGVPLFDDVFKTTKTYEKVLRALYSESRKAVAATSQSLRAVMASEGYAGKMLGIMNSLFFLKRIPMQVFFDRTLIPIYRGEYGEAAKFFSQNIIFTAARLTLKSLAMGYVPDYTDPKFYREVLLQNAAMLPFLQPMFSMDRIDRFNVENALGRAFLGAWSPAVDVAQLVVRDTFTDVSPTQLAKDVHRVVKDFAPIKSHPALGLLYERYIFDNIILAMDPEAYRTLARAEKVRTESGKIKVF